MSLSRRLGKLESEVRKLHAPPGWMPPRWNWDEEFDRWVRQLNIVLDLLVDETLMPPVIDYQIARLEELIHLLRMGPDSDRLKQENLAEYRRWPAVLRILFERVPQDLRARVATHEALLGNATGTPWANRWLQSMVRLRSRIPLDLTPETMRAIIDVYLGSREMIDTLHEICDTCGLSRPHHKAPPYSEWGQFPTSQPGEPFRIILPEFFTCCPHCEAADWMWEHRTPEKDYAWRDLAVDELDHGE
ncbi:MAG: hypothetical protein JWO38_6275 [Gemmataceae bacterium]|nr:hypothetical protein [Gemmataceae bacterium]